MNRDAENLTRGPKVRFKKSERLQVKKHINEVSDYEDLDDDFETFEKVKKAGA